MTQPTILFEGVERLSGAPPPVRTHVGQQLRDLDRVTPKDWIPFWGPGRVAGTVKVLTVPAPGRVVRLYDRASGKLAFETISAADGSYAFPSVFRGAGARHYYAVALDTQPGGYNATIEDMVVPAS